MAEDAPLFALVGPRLPAGRVRRGLDADVKAARTAGATLPAAGVAVCRSLADVIDNLERLVRSPQARPYDRIPLTGLVREFGEAYDRTFATVQRAQDPLAAALDEFLAGDLGTGAQVGDLEEPRPPD